MRHSFGCIVTSSIAGGPLDYPLDSVVLVQGALSLWSYAWAIPFDHAGPGIFTTSSGKGRFAGRWSLLNPATTRPSPYGTNGPRACRVTWHTRSRTFPKYGAVAAFGLQGLDGAIRRETAMLAANGEYGFLPAKIYNLEASQFICQGSGLSGAHSDIAGPEVAHAIWHAAFASGG
jgi:hypothetical protein